MGGNGGSTSWIKWKARDRGHSCLKKVEARANDILANRKVGSKKGRVFDFNTYLFN